MIERQNRQWGVRLLVRPFSARKYADLEIQADVHKPPTGQRKDIKITFRAPSEPLRLTDARIWMAAMAAIVEEAEKVAEELAPKKPERPRSK